jgi:ribulose-5-phosphate 4-epimerase/fuculose-1-phosphate aldolase
MVQITLGEVLKSANWHTASLCIHKSRPSVAAVVHGTKSNWAPGSCLVSGLEGWAVSWAQGGIHRPIWALHPTHLCMGGGSRMQGETS